MRTLIKTVAAACGMCLSFACATVQPPNRPLQSASAPQVDPKVSQAVPPTAEHLDVINRLSKDAQRACLDQGYDVSVLQVGTAPNPEAGHLVYECVAHEPAESGDEQP